MKKLLITLLLALLSFAGELSINSKLPTFSLSDQFDTKYTVDKDTKIIIVSFEKGTGKEVNEFLDTKDADFLQKHNAVFIANISGMPMFITKIFALPKMRNYKHKILLIYDDEDDRFAFQEGSSTLYKLEDGVVKKIEFIHRQDLEKVFDEDTKTANNEY
jgi:hypothetical protein